MGRICRQGTLAALALGTVALLPASAWAGSVNERFAEPSGNGPAGTCAFADPCSIVDAVESITVDPGDTVTLLPGTYALGGDELTMTEGTILRGQPGQARPLLTSSSQNGVRVDSAAGAATIRGIEITHTGNGSALLLSTSSHLAEQVLVRSTGFLACGGAAVWRGSICIINGGGGGIGALGTSVGGGGTSTLIARNVTAISTINDEPAIGIQAFTGADVAVDARNVIAFGTNLDVRALTDSMASTSAGVTLASSNFDTVAAIGTLASVTPAGPPSNQSLLPQFVNAAGEDFHQLGASPMVNAGTNGSMLGTVDFDGQARTIGCAIDIGADELSPDASCSSANPPGGNRADPPARKKCKKKKKKKRTAAAAKKGCKKKKKKK